MVWCLASCRQDNTVDGGLVLGLDVGRIAPWIAV